MKNVKCKIKDFFLDLFFPIECLGCGKEGEWVCASCFQTMPLNTNEECPRCRNFSQNGQTCLNCRTRGYYLDGLIAATHYDHPLARQIITKLKYNYIKDLAEPLAKIIINGLRFRGLFLEEEWILTPVPLHRKRRLERGFNQAELLCERLSQATGMSQQLFLKRRFFTPPQAELLREDRLINLKNVFVCQGGREIKNKKILLVDDVFTTGMTLNEAAKALKAAGAKEVWGLVGAKG